MEHFVLTRCAYSPSWPREANWRRLERLRRVAAASLALQTNKNWEWAVSLNEADPYLKERREAIESIGIPVRIAWWNDKMAADPPRKPEIDIPPFKKAMWKDDHSRRVAYKYIETGRRIWEEVLPVGGVPLLMTRLDDDDAIIPTYLEKVKAVADKNPSGFNRVAWVFPNGFHYHQGRYQPYHHPKNMMLTLQTWPPDLFTALSVEHNEMPQHAEVRFVDTSPAWVWMRHQDAIDEAYKTTVYIDDFIKSLFPIDWDYINANP